MTCKDCIHYFVCYRIINNIPITWADKCGDFIAEQESKIDILDKIRAEIRKHCEYYMDGDIIADEVIQAVENIGKAGGEG